MATANSHDFDLVVIGAGSGGMATARRAAQHGAKVAIVERGPLGGTCVNVGCVPKKIWWNAAHLSETMHHGMEHYGFSLPESGRVPFNWGTLKANIDAYILRLNGIYRNNLRNSGCAEFEGDATLKSAREVAVQRPDGSSITLTGKNVLVAVGGYPVTPDVEGAGLSITSDGFSELEHLPRKAAVVGGGYIAVELAGVLNGLGCETHLLLRKEGVLRSFEGAVTSRLTEEMTRNGVHIHTETGGVARIGGSEGDLTVHAASGLELDGCEQVLFAVGRAPAVDSLGLAEAGVQLTERGTIAVDEYQESSVPGVYALGDVTGEAELTPVAIAAGRILADRLFLENPPRTKMDYADIPTVIFSHPTIGTVGLTESEAETAYGPDDIKVYESTFVNLSYGPYTIPPADKPRSYIKLICVGEDERVVGLHIIGDGADEMLQGFGVAVKMGATKADLDRCVAIHPTAAEEVVTLAPWGLRE